MKAQLEFISQPCPLLLSLRGSTKSNVPLCVYGSSTAAVAVALTVGEAVTGELRDPGRSSAKMLPPAINNTRATTPMIIPIRLPRRCGGAGTGAGGAAG